MIATMRMALRRTLALQARQQALLPIPAQRPFLAVLPASSPLRLPQPSLSPCISTQLPGRSISMAAAAHSQQAVSTLEQEAPGMAAQHGPGAAPGSSNPRPYPPKDLDHTSAPSFLDNIDCILFDCDGVLWTGSHQVPGAAEALRVLRSRGKRLLFVTNNASKSRAGYVSKFKSLGLEVAAEEIVSASYAAAAYVASLEGFGPGGGKRALVLANSGVEQELDTAGVAWVGGEAWRPPLYDSTDAMAEIELDASIGAVVVGWDPHFSYSRLVYASACIRELPGCAFVATNPDHADTIGPPKRSPVAHAPLPSVGPPSAAGAPSSAAGAPPSSLGPSGNQGAAVQNGTGSQPAARRMMPGTGCMVAAVATACDKDPLVVGKGGPWLLPHLMSLYGLQPSRTVIVGDRLDTDVALGKEGGLWTIVPLTGVTTRDQAMSAVPHDAPDFLIPSVAALAGLVPHK